MEGIRQGSVSVKNPYNPNQISEISLKSEDVNCIVFWTKNPKPFLPHLKELDDAGYVYYFSYTVNTYGSDVESGLPPLKDRLKTFRDLSEKIGQEKVIWRYNPVLFTKEYNLDYHLGSFTRLAAELEGYTKSCILSFLDWYPKIKKRMTALGAYEPDELLKEELMCAIAETARNYEIVINTCYQPKDYSRYGVKAGSCIDSKLIEHISGRTAPHTKDKGQPPDCQCATSRDIGTYNTCKHGCTYCYAKR